MIFTVYKRGEGWHYRRELAPGVAKCSNSGWPTCLGALLTATFVTQLAMPLLTGIALAVLCVGLIGALMERLLTRL